MRSTTSEEEDSYSHALTFEWSGTGNEQIKNIINPVNKVGDVI